ncbi:MAG: hypothetical protein AAGC55_31530, partial [Myxococcota bacterium]
MNPFNRTRTAVLVTGLSLLAASSPAFANNSMFGVDGILDMCLNTTPAPWTQFEECIFDLDSQSIIYCSPGLGGAVQPLASQPAQGLVVEVDMAGWDSMLVAAVADSLNQYAFHIGNDPANNGWAGGSSLYDSEAHLYGNSLNVYRGDTGGSTLLSNLSNAVPGGAGAFCATVQDGYFKWLREDASATNQVSAMQVWDPAIFRITPQSGANDSKL